MQMSGTTDLAHFLGTRADSAHAETWEMAEGGQRIAVVASQTLLKIKKCRLDLLFMNQEMISNIQLLIISYQHFGFIRKAQTIRQRVKYEIDF